MNMCPFLMMTAWSPSKSFAKPTCLQPSWEPLDPSLGLSKFHKELASQLASRSTGELCQVTSCISWKQSKTSKLSNPSGTCCNQIAVSLDASAANAGFLGGTYTKSADSPVAGIWPVWRKDNNNAVHLSHGTNAAPSYRLFNNFPYSWRVSNTGTIGDNGKPFPNVKNNRSRLSLICIYSWSPIWYLGRRRCLPKADNQI